MIASVPAEWESVLVEFHYDVYDLASEVIRLRKLSAKVQHDLDAAVGYKLATDAEIKGDQDRDV